jgi:two-component system response regulator MprA
MMAQAQSARILIVDDDEAVRQTFARMLRLEGHEVRTAADATAALEQADIQKPQVILMDLRMPLVDGLGLLYRLRALPGHARTPVAIITGDYFIDDTVMRELESLGAQLRFKPLWLEDLVDLAHLLLASPELVPAPSSMKAN